MEIMLDQAIATALKQNRGLEIVRLDLESRLVGLESAEADFRVILSPSANYQVSSDVKMSEVGAAASRKTALGTEAEARGTWTRTESTGDDDLYRGLLRIEVKQPLLRNMGPLPTLEPVRKAESSVLAARREMELRKADLVVRVVETFEEMLLLRRQVEFDEQTLERLDQLLRLTEVREIQGHVSRVDVLRVELQRGEAQLRLNSTKERYRSIQSDFADLLGCAPDTTFTAVPGPVLQPGITNETEATGVAMSNRLDLAQVLQDCEDSRRGVRIARRNLLPDLGLLSRYERSGDGPSSSDAGNLDQDTWFVGLTMASDLDRREERLALRSASLSRETAEQTAADVEAGVRRQVQQALLSYERTQADILFAERNYHVARNRAALARRMFEMGRGDNFSATDAENALLDARNQMLKAQSDASVAAYRLLRTMGTLLESPDELKPGRRDRT